MPSRSSSGKKKGSALRGLLSDPPFDPEGSGYDSKTAAELDKLWPLTLPKPTNPPENPAEFAYRVQEDAIKAWVWHPKEKDWFIHGASRDPRTGQMLKGRKHISWAEGVQGERASGNTVYKDPESKLYFSFPTAAVMAKASPSRAATFRGSRK